LDPNPKLSGNSDLDPKQSEKFGVEIISNVGATFKIGQVGVKEFPYMYSENNF
jgi:hypothetical protein